MSSILNAAIKPADIEKFKDEIGAEFDIRELIDSQQVLPSPPKKLINVTPQQLAHLLSILEAGQPADQLSTARIWLEVIRRFVEINRRSLYQASVKRFGGQENARTVTALILHCLAVASSQNKCEADRKNPDVTLLNAALYLVEAKELFVLNKLSSAGSDYSQNSRFHALKAHKIIYDLVQKLPRLIAERGLQTWANVTPPAEPEKIELENGTPDADFSVVVLCPNILSFYTVATLYLLSQHKIPVKALVVRKMLSFSRLKEEFSFSAERLMDKVINKLVHRHGGEPADERYSPSAYMEKLGCKHKNAVKLAEELGVPVYHFDNFNSEKARTTFRKLKASHAVFTGGGLIKADTLDCFKEGIIHCHPGVLPQYRGMDVIQWALLEGQYDQVGATVQIMDSGVDTGPVVHQMFKKPKDFENFAMLRNAVITGKIDLLVDAILDLQNGDRVPVAQPAKSGKQYFLMHKVLHDIAVAVLPVQK